MGALCCCFYVPDDDNSSDSASSNNSLCSKWFFQKFVNKHRTGQVHEISSRNQQTPSSNSCDASGSHSITSRSRVQPEPVGHIRVCVNQKTDRGSQEQNPDYSAKVSSSDYDNSCPTCFEEYTVENPKIIMKCSHHYHLGCIYEWMERSKNCPVCSKLMLFDESR